MFIDWGALFFFSYVRGGIRQISLLTELRKQGHRNQ